MDLLTSGLLELEDQKMLALLACLSYQEEACELNQLASKLQVHPKTLRSYLAKWQAFIRSVRLSAECQIVFVTKKQVRWSHKSRLSYSLLKQKYLEQLPEIQLLLKTSRQEGCCIQTIRRQLRLSESTVRKKSVRVKNWLRTFGLRVSRATYELVGDERVIRNWLVEFYWQVFAEPDAILIEFADENLVCITDKLLAHCGIKLDYFEKMKWLLYLRITRFRYTSSQELQVPEMFRKQLSHSSLLEEFMQDIGLERAKGFFSKNELLGLWIAAQLKFAPISSLTNQQQFLAVHCQTKTNAYKRMTQAVTLMKKRFWQQKLALDHHQQVLILTFYLRHEMGLPIEESITVTQYTATFPKLKKEIDRFVEHLANKQDSFGICHRVPSLKQLRYFYETFFLQLKLGTVYEPVCVLSLMTDLPREQELLLAAQLTAEIEQQRPIKIIFARNYRVEQPVTILLTNQTKLLPKELHAQKIFYFNQQDFHEVLPKIKQFLHSPNI